ncbi:MAG: hypothetical protein A3A89_00395 [Candidatus Magasanikbacteria bacterium RIFCSPLOWO2_01_FULL_33_34]|nr:MAG: hypothetical protein A3B83_00485 [Candidatus Magasanikbacteria bacterium RIFCSPHIGHO2_02_FULL_33_17]OGH75945.1 MAG: hypothetical protein A3A89_00395 [Candidatus Magasanikbacteria bacterium RIFCSPLOWO2_01_FULL_33_34]OGH80943.1 MAG: hypothetical protein A3F93_02405 [Candidatus Magasanikbacteria bacterium RIFCSPLOWO2_12_FULL_34_7]
MVVFTAPLNPSFPPGTEIPQSVIKVIEDLPRTNSLTVAEAIDKIHKQMKEERIAITKAIQDSYIKSIIISEVSSKKWYTLAYGDNLDNKSLMEITEQLSHDPTILREPTQREIDTVRQLEVDFHIWNQPNRTYPSTGLIMVEFKCGDDFIIVGILIDYKPAI